jgi:hypothetical protein
LSSDRSKKISEKLFKIDERLNRVAWKIVVPQLIPLDVAHHSGMMSPGATRPLLAPLRSHLSALRRGTWMPTERFAMRHVRDVIRLKSAGMPTREIARRLGTAPSTARLTIRRFEAAGLSWPLPDGVTDTELEARLFASAGAGLGTRRGYRRQAEPDWAAVHRELRRKHVTLSILWEEYIAGEPGGYRYSSFCELYCAWESRLSVTMRQSHAAGDKLFVDYAADGVPVVIDRLTGERRTAQIFVAVLGASNFTYAQATWTQGLADWIGGHVGAFEGGLRWATLFYRRSGDARHAGLFEKAALDAVDCALISKRATDPQKKELFDRLADHLALLASELERDRGEGTTLAAYADSHRSRRA